jgi:TolA-binding protein
VEKSTQVLALEQRQRALRERRQDDRDKALLVQKKQNDAAPSGVLLAKASSKVTPMPVLAKWKKLPEFDLYRATLNASDNNDEFGFRGMSETFLKRFPKSSLRDDVLYLSGLMNLTKKNYGAALVDFNQILKKHATSNRASSAMFAKGVTLKRMNLEGEARLAFLQVKRKFAGSPEALRADNELKQLR